MDVIEILQAITISIV